MSIIIPYDKELGSSDGAFIRPDGKILHTDANNHEDFARRYCNGPDYEILTGATYGPPHYLLRDHEIIKTAQAIQENPDFFSTSNLTKTELHKYKKWLQRYNKHYKDIYSDFLVFVLAYDKVETNIRNVITTTSAEPHTRFFNYYLMDWHIIRQDRIVYNEEQEKFIVENRDMFFDNLEDREVEEEIRLIKDKIPLSERAVFFR